MVTENQNSEAEKIERQIKFVPWIAWAFVILGFIAGGYGVWAIPTDHLGDLGSYLQGAVSSLWSLAALLFIYVAFLAQKLQLIQQEAQLADQKRQFQLQYESIKRQNFESSFFQLLNLHNQLVSEMGERSKGKQQFLQWYSTITGEVDQWLKRRGITNPTPDHLANQNLITEFFQEWYNQHESSLGHYFRTLYHVIKFVKESEIEPKKRYTSLVRAQLSKFELWFLFYNCITENGKGFKPLVEEFRLLEHLDKRLLLDPKHEKFYAPSAFK